MNYSKNMRDAANRHFSAATALRSTSNSRVAGYLYGIATECAIKKVMQNLGIRELAANQRKDDPYYAHFETFRTMLRDTVSGRAATNLRRIAEDDSFMQHWDTSMRYSDGTQIDPAWIERWHENAVTAIAMMDE
jgi:hypothetical protein